MYRAQGAGCRLGHAAHGGHVEIGGFKCLGMETDVSRRSFVAVMMVMLVGVFTSAAMASPRSSQYDNPGTKEPVKAEVLGTKRDHRQGRSEAGDGRPEAGDGRPAAVE